MGELGSDDVKISTNLHPPKPRLKRSHDAMFRDCEAGASRAAKKVKESNHETAQHLIEHKPTTVHDSEKLYTRRYHEVGSNRRSVGKKLNSHGK